MKQYVLLRGGVETLGFFSEQIAALLKERGESCFLFTLSEEVPQLPELERFLGRKGTETILLTFNFHGLQQEAIFYDGQGRLLWDRYQVECRNIVVDHPFYYYKELKILPDRYVQICIDWYHEAYMRRFYPEIRLGLTTPLAGTRWQGEAGAETGKMPAPTEARSRGLVFTGNYTPPEQFDRHITRLGPEYEAFYREMIGELLAHPDRTMEAVFEEYMCREMGRLSEEELREGMNSLIFIDLYVRFEVRGRAVKSLVDAGIPVEVCGSGWNRLNVNRPDLLKVDGPLDSAGCLRKLSEAKMSLNVMPWFKKGSHDRIYNSMWNGAVALSDPSEYLTGILGDGREILFYSLADMEALPDLAARYLERPERLQEIADRAAAWAERHASWEGFLDRVCGTAKEAGKEIGKE